MNFYFLLAAFALIGGLFAMANDPGPTTHPAKPQFGEMRVATLEAMTFLYIDLETSFATLPKDVDPAIDRLNAAAINAKIEMRGGVIFRYPAGGDMNGKFTMQIGYKVHSDAKAAEGTKVIKLPAFKCATVNYTGPMMHMKEAFGFAYGEIKKAGLKPAGEFRESYFYFESPESDNDVTQLQIAVE